jgi:hypothetical protein
LAVGRGAQQATLPLSLPARAWRPRWRRAIRLGLLALLAAALPMALAVLAFA